MKRFINNRIKHKKIGQQIAEEILEAQRRADEFSSSSSQSSNSPPSSLDTVNSGSSINGSMSGSGSSSSINEKLGPRRGYDLKSLCGQSMPSLTTSDSGIDNTSFDNFSIPSIQSLSNSSLTDISQLEPIPMNNMRFLEPTMTASEMMPHMNNHSIVVNQRINNNVVFNGNPIQQNDANEESDEAAMSLIVSTIGSTFKQN